MSGQGNTCNSFFFLGGGQMKCFDDCATTCKPMSKCTAKTKTMAWESDRNVIIDERQNCESYDKNCKCW